MKHEGEKAKTILCFLPLKGHLPDMQKLSCLANILKQVIWVSLSDPCNFGVWSICQDVQCILLQYFPLMKTSAVFPHYLWHCFHSASNRKMQDQNEDKHPSVHGGCQKTQSFGWQSFWSRPTLFCMVATIRLFAVHFVEINLMSRTPINDTIISTAKWCS